MPFVYLTGDRDIVAVHDEVVPIEAYAPNGAATLLSLPAEAIVRGESGSVLAPDWKAIGLANAIRYETDRRKAAVVGASSVAEMRSIVSDANLEAAELLQKRADGGLTKKEEARAAELQKSRVALREIDVKAAEVLEAQPDDPTTDAHWSA